MMFKYYTRTFDTVLTDDNELMRYHYTNIYNPLDTISMVEGDVDIQYFERLENMVIDGEPYKDIIVDIVRDMLSRKDCKFVSVEHYDIDTSRYTVDEIVMFIWIMQDNIDDDIPVDFYFDDFRITPLYKCKRFSIYC